MDQLNINETEYLITDNTTITDIDFNDYRKLRKIIVDNSDIYCSDKGVLFNKDKTKLIRFPIDKKDIRYTVPDTVTHIGNNAFYGCKNLTEIIIPKSVIDIGKNAFCECKKLRKVDIEGNVGSIKEKTFYNCKSLLIVNIKDSFNKIEAHSFENCKNLIGIINQNDCLYTDTKDYFCYSKSILPKCITHIGDCVFMNCNKLIEVYVFDNVKEFGKEVFKNCLKLRDIIISNHCDGLVKEQIKNEYGNIVTITIKNIIFDSERI